MVPEEWPVAASSKDEEPSLAHRAAGVRLATARADFFLDPQARLSEQERALMTGMLTDLLVSVSDEIKALLPTGAVAANDGENQEIVARLRSSRLLERDDLVGLLLRRADEARIAGAVQSRSGLSPAFLQALIASSQAEVAASAMALIHARGRRRGRLGQPRIELDDLPESLARGLAFAVAAATRPDLSPSIEGRDSDRMLETAALAYLDGREPTKRIEAQARALVRALLRAGKLDEPLLAAAAEEGDVAFLVEALGERAEIASDAAWTLLLGGCERMVLLLRMAGISRDLAARLLVGLGDLVGITDLGEAMRRFVELDEAPVAEEGEWLRRTADYRAAVRALGGRDG